MKSIFQKALVSFALISATAPLGLAQQACKTNSAGVRTTVDGLPCVNTIVTSLPFLRIVPDARSGAMGDVGLAIAPDANTMHFNASKLAFAEKDMGLSATYTPWLRALGLNDVYLAYLSGYKNIDKRQTIGVSLRYFSLGRIDFTDDAGTGTGFDNPNELELNVAYARKFSPNFSGALSLKYIYSRLAGVGQRVGANGPEIRPVNAVAADLSFTYRKAIKISDQKANICIGSAITNIGPKVSYTGTSTDRADFVPTNLGIGVALGVDLDEFNSITVAVDANKLLVPTPKRLGDKDYDLVDGVPGYKRLSPIQGMITSFSDAPGGFSEEMKEINYSVGLEYWYDKQFAVRAGYYSEDVTKGNRQFLTAGLGLKYNIFGLNFSYLVPTSTVRNPLDNTLRFSLLFDLGAFREPDEGGKKKK